MVSRCYNTTVEAAQRSGASGIARRQMDPSRRTTIGRAVMGGSVMKEKSLP